MIAWTSAYPAPALGVRTHRIPRLFASRAARLVSLELATFSIHIAVTWPEAATTVGPFPGYALVEQTPLARVLVAALLVSVLFLAELWL